MLRFVTSRWWAPAFALLLGLIGFVVMPSLGRAEAGGQQFGGEGTGTPSTGDPTGSGDPDIPSGPIKGASRPAVRLGRASTQVMRRDGVFLDATGEAAWIMKLRIAFEAYRVIVLHR